MSCNRCPKCGKPKGCDDDYCFMCELKETATSKVKQVLHIGGSNAESARQSVGEPD